MTPSDAHPQPGRRRPATASRRACLRLGLGAALAPAAGSWPAAVHAAPEEHAAPILPPRALVFERDHGSHPDFQTEWWYVTGALHLHAAAGGLPDYGFQVTFFRSRVAAADVLQSSFAARQLLFAHVAVTDVAAGRLLHDERIARAGHGLAFASTARMDAAIGDWTLASIGPARPAGPARHRARIAARGIALDLTFEDSQPVLLQGRNGLSRKGPLPEQASYYYSRPQLKVGGTLGLPGTRAGAQAVVSGTAWLDHEWSQSLLSRDAEGWDWIGMNLDDGSALTAFRLRRPDGSALWAGGSWRAGGRPARAFEPGEVAWTPRRPWLSPRSGTRYPVEWDVATPAGTFRVQALADDQELDASASTGGIYWEGLCSLLDAQGRRIGSGYLEMTGYQRALRVR